ncbi:ras small monomeric GTPase rasa [Massariosphaeria phaeospora]|uniref:Ras small monomeric GTPase rasa n=1 Tax=Massariosphaeria phaeospora TaxID=100035 RepID=A0A7C8MAN1_9PLEO|nr:ras small monomeric GTPase rasa [Massariosphaeria phaeospora]
MYRKEYTVTVMGAAGVGKTSFISQFISGIFPHEDDPTMDLSNRKLCLVDDERVLFDILNTASMEECSAMLEVCMERCEVMIIIYSITNRESFLHVSTFGHNLLQLKKKDYFPMLVVGTRSDEHHEREVSTEEGMAFASQNRCGFLEASTKSNHNIEKAFYDIAHEIRQYSRDHPPLPHRMPFCGICNSDRGSYGIVDEKDLSDFDGPHITYAQKTL